MNNLYSRLIIVISAIVVLVAVGCIADYCAYAIYDRAYSVSSPYDLWNTLLEKKRTNEIVRYLRDNDWVVDDVDDEELDYILVLSKQIADMYDNVRPELVMAMIAVESHFNSSAGSKAGALGLMQIIPRYHKNRIMQFVDADTKYTPDLFNNIRLNVATGIDYISEILRQADGDEAFALMWYNQGAESADRTYKRGVVSSYARAVLSTAEDISVILNKEPTFH